MSSVEVAMVWLRSSHGEVKDFSPDKQCIGLDYA